MPSGKVHDELWKKSKAAPVIVALMVYGLFDITLYRIFPYSCIGRHCVSNALLIAIGVPLGYLLGKVVTPDLDLFGITTTEWYSIRKAGVFGLIFVMYWLPYGYLFKGRHRHYWSHSYFVSTLVRVVYMSWWTFFIVPYTMYFVLWFGMYLGLAISDCIHIWADYNYKRRR